MKKIPLKKEIYNLLIVLLICAISILPYLHDFEFFKGKKGFSGFSSLRIAVWVISLFVVAISGWVFALIKSKGVLYRFVFLVPITMLVFQLCIYVLDARKSVVNGFDTKLIVNLLLVIIIAVFYFKRKFPKK